VGVAKGRDVAKGERRKENEMWVSRKEASRKEAGERRLAKGGDVGVAKGVD